MQGDRAPPSLRTLPLPLTVVRADALEVDGPLLARHLVVRAAHGREEWVRQGAVHVQAVLGQKGEQARE